VRLLDADQPILLLHVVHVHARHAEGIAPHVRGHVRARRPPSLARKDVLAAAQAHDRDRGEAGLAVRGGEHDRVVARDRLELGVAYGNGVRPLRERGHFRRRKQAHLLVLEKGDDFLVAEGRGDLHGAIIARSRSALR
jgi:hypothetical protein